MKKSVNGDNSKPKQKKLKEMSSHQWNISYPFSAKAKDNLSSQYSVTTADLFVCRMKVKAQVFHTILLRKGYGILHQITKLFD